MRPRTNAPPRPTSSAAGSTRGSRKATARRRTRCCCALMAGDAAEQVRRALAVTLKASPTLPRDVAMKLAADVESIALPVINHSPAFDDEDLAEIVRSPSALKRTAVAKRSSLSEHVTLAIARHGCEDAVKTACANDNAAFSRGRPARPPSTGSPTARASPRRSPSASSCLCRSPSGWSGWSPTRCASIWLTATPCRPRPP